ncbi:MAG: hypothetical protein OXH08_07290 [Gammaproteobacteria bacterium]|nr:hypothetical protein [Gammaproteobacteria bacterium]MDE2716312.1 hypothetical protein [Chloroflexota bacterium]
MTSKPGPVAGAMKYCERCGESHLHVTPELLDDVHGSEDDFAETEDLKQHMADMLRYREPYAFLNLDDLDRILRWKLRSQHARNAHLHERLTAEMVQSVTETAFAVHLSHGPSDDAAARVCLDMLSTLPGVRIPVASAILAMTFPAHHCVVDVRVWRLVFGERKPPTLGSNHYLRYRTVVACIANTMDWSIQETDLSLWELDRRQTLPASVTTRHSGG